MDKIRDLREKFFRMDDEYLNGYARLCGINATGVYLSMCRHANRQQTCFPSKKLIAEELAISERSVYRALLTLEEWGIIKKEGQGRKENGLYKNTLYTLLSKSVWKEKPSATQADREGATVCHTGSQRSATQAGDGLPQVPNKETHINKTHINQKPPTPKGATDSQNLPGWMNKKSWEEWTRYRKERKKTMTPLAQEKAIAFLSQHKADHEEIIETSIRNSWTGLFPLKKDSRGQPEQKGASVAERYPLFSASPEAKNRLDTMKSGLLKKMSINQTP